MRQIASAWCPRCKLNLDITEPYFTVSKGVDRPYWECPHCDATVTDIQVGMLGNGEPVLSLQKAMLISAAGGMFLLAWYLLMQVV